jgi:hypothetical protein
MSIESDSLQRGDVYYLLRTYARESKILSKAYAMSESYYRNLYKYLTYPLVVLTTISTLISGLEINTYVVISINLAMLLLIGFNTTISPKDKEHSAHTVSGEFGEIKASINQFITENSKSADDCRNYSQLVLEQVKIWKSLSPPVKDKYMNIATKQCARKVRNTHPQLQKKNMPIDSVEGSPKLRLSDILIKE